MKKELNSEVTFYKRIQSPVGKLRLIADRSHVLAVIFEKNFTDWKKSFPVCVAKTNSVLDETSRQLEEYFSGDRKSFDLPVKLQGTDFQMKVWKALSKIPYGQTISYKQQAALVKNPMAVRAVGRTNGANPVCIIFGCHRVIGSDGSLTGYAGGIWRKQWLLDHEAKISGRRLSLF